MNLTSTKDNFLFHTFWYFEPLSSRQCDQNKKKKSPQKLKEFNQSFNAG